MSSYVIIGIHGLANKPEEKILKKWWTESLLEGLRRNEGRGTGGVELDLVYWRDWGYAKPIPGSKNEEPYLKAEGKDPLPRYRDSLWDELREEASDWLDTPLDWVKRTFGVGKVADVVLRTKLRDLARYYEQKTKRELLRSRLEERILENSEKRIMLIAHSMGSIVAYDVLRLLGRSRPMLRVDHFVTIGSPLGLPHVKYKIWQDNDRVRTPSIVRRWTNLADRRDPVAVDTHLAGDFAPNDRGVKVHDDLVINGYRNSHGRANFHKSYGYLRAPELSELVRSFI